MNVERRRCKFIIYDSNTLAAAPLPLTLCSAAAGFEEYLACRQAVYEGGIVVGANMVRFKSGKVGKLGLPVVDEGRVLVVHEPDSRPFDFARSIPGAFPSVPTFDVSLTERATLPEKVGESEKWWSEERVGLKRQYVPDQR